MAEQPTEAQVQEMQARFANMSPEEKQKLMEDQCLFCKIVKGEIKAKKVYEDADILAFLDINPATPGHILVIPKGHYMFIPQMPDELVAKMFKVIKHLIATVHQTLEPKIVQLLQVGTEVPHVHIHIIPRYENDGQDTLYQPYKPIKLTDEQFDSIQGKINAVSQNIQIDSDSKEKQPEVIQEPIVEILPEPIDVPSKVP